MGEGSCVDYILIIFQAICCEKVARKDKCSKHNYNKHEQ